MPKVNIKVATWNVEYAKKHTFYVWVASRIDREHFRKGRKSFQYQCIGR